MQTLLINEAHNVSSNIFHQDILRPYVYRESTVVSIFVNTFVSVSTIVSAKTDRRVTSVTLENEHFHQSGTTVADLTSILGYTLSNL